MNKDTKSLKLEIWKWKISLVACSSLIFVQQIYITYSHICHLEEKIHNLEYCLSRTPLSHQRRLRELEEQVALVVAHTNLSEHRVSCACCIQTFYMSQFYSTILCISALPFFVTFDSLNISSSSKKRCHSVHLICLCSTCTLQMGYILKVVVVVVQILMSVIRIDFMI